MKLLSRNVIKIAVYMLMLIMRGLISSLYEGIDSGKKIDLKTSALIKQACKEQQLAITVDNLDKILHKPQQKNQSKAFSINRKKFKSFANKLPGDKELENLFFEFLKERFGS